ncbi:MAG: S24 family peptidase [Coxiellaceae bacterium]|nr:S24 family peptidase [Coxiellaceae bacterium]
MELSSHYPSNIHNALRALIDQKSIRDKKKFTIYQLAKALEMPHSMLVKLTHSDPNKRVTNPRIETLTKIVNFFRQDGFEISINDLLSEFITNTRCINVADQIAETLEEQKTIPLYTMNDGFKKPANNIEISLEKNVNCSFALLSNEDIKPIFKKGSIFIVDKNAEPENDTLVAVTSKSSNRVIIRKLYIEGHKYILRSYDKKAPTIEMKPSNNYQIIGVIVHVNART